MGASRKMSWGTQSMTTRRSLLAMSAVGLATCFGSSWSVLAAAEPFAVTHTDDEWRKLLKPDQYAVLRQSATERPFSSPLLNEHRAGVFGCVGCDRGLFSSETKFDSGTGWPVSGRRSMTERLARRPTPGSAWSAPQCTARAAAGILGTFSTTGPRSPACATA
jgi:peptide-methionine (R)-S-oxide reductase